MGKIVTVHYTDTQPAATTTLLGQQGSISSSPSGFNAAISITSAKLIVVRVPFLSEGIIKQVVIKQSSGSSFAYVAELLMSSVPYPTIGLQADSVSAAGTIELFRIVPQMAANAGAAVDITPDTDVGWAFRNVDGNHTNNQRYIYLMIKPTSSNTTTKWDVFIMGQNVE